MVAARRAGEAVDAAGRAVRRGRGRGAGAPRCACRSAPRRARAAGCGSASREPAGSTPRSAAFLVACAAQTALALERGRLYEETRDVAHSLQRSLLAGAPPQDPRFEVATLYRPAVAHLEVGGDWHDAFTLAAGKVGIVVGDVVGRGIAAASAMGQLRSAVRALAGAGLAPAAVLDHLDTFVEQVDAARYATLAYAEVDPGTGDVTFASAGHLPAVLIGPDGAPAAAHGGPLGAAGRDGTRQPARARRR